MSEKQDCLLI